MILVFIFIFIILLISIRYIVKRFDIIFESSLYKYTLRIKFLSNDFCQPLYDKFWIFIDEKRKEENVFLTFYDSIEKLNEVRLNKKSNDLACGLYTYLKAENDSPETRKLWSLPEIKLYDKDVWIYAHELGHHFAVNYKNDDSEDAADAYIKFFAEECFSPLELHFLKSTIEIYSKQKLQLDENVYLDYEKLEMTKFKKDQIKKFNQTFFSIPIKIFNFMKNKFKENQITKNIE